MNKFSMLLILLVSVSVGAFATPLTAQEKIEFQKSSVPSCIAKNNASRDLTTLQKEGLNNYCICHGAVMTSLVTREEIMSLSKGKLPTTFQGKVSEAQKQCIKALSN
jgi:hypothetical protein